MKKGMKISKIVTDKYKLRIPPTVYYDLLADVVEAEEEQEPKTGHWIRYKDNCCYNKCSICEYEYCKESNYYPNCGAKMVEPLERSRKEW